MRIKDIVIANLTTLMAEQAECSSQNLFAKKSGVSQSHIGRILRGESDPSLEMIESLCLALKVKPNVLLTENLGRSPANKSDEATLSPSGQRLIDRLTLLDRNRLSPPALYALIENALDLVNPVADGNDYSGLNDL